MKATDLAIGIDMGGTTVKYGVVRGHEVIHECDPLRTSDYAGAKVLLAKLIEEVNVLQKRYRIRALGMGVPGFTDVRTGYVHELTNVPGWLRVKAGAVLEKGTGLPVTVENDANAMCYAEWAHGAGKGAENMIAVTLGTGVGGALVIGGQLYRGSAFGAGEIGQMSIDYAGRMGEHGNRGALEKYVGNRETRARAVELSREAGRKVAESDCEPHLLAAAARRGDKVALAVWDEFTTQLAAGLSACVWLLNPDRIIIGGGVAKAGTVVFDPLRRKIREQVAEPFRKGLKIVPAKFGNDAGIIGAAGVALSRVP
jgi:glucokinase